MRQQKCIGFLPGIMKTSEVLNIRRMKRPPIIWDYQYRGFHNVLLSVVPPNISKQIGKPEKGCYVPSEKVLLQPKSCLFSQLATPQRCFHPLMKTYSRFCLSMFATGGKCDVKDTVNTVTYSPHACHIPMMQLRGYSDSKKETLNVHELLDNVLRNAELPGVLLESSHLSSNQRRRSRIKRNICDDDFENSDDRPLTVEKKLLNLMKMWKMDEAVDLLVESLKSGFIPNSGVILNLLQQLAHLGEVDNILELHDEFLEGKNITREVKFYALLTEAYCNSGRVEEGVAMLRIIYHKTRNFDDINAFFSMITIMVIRNFEHRLNLIVDFVDDLMESDPPVDKSLGCLWKCLVLTERFNQADALLEEHEKLVKFIPAQVSEIVNAPFFITYDKDIVLPWLMNLPHIKASLKAAVFEALIESKCQNNNWQEALDCLRHALVDDVSIVKPSTLTLFFTNFLSQLSDQQVKELEDWAVRLEDQNEAENELDKTDDNKDL